MNKTPIYAVAAAALISTVALAQQATPPTTSDAVSPSTRMAPAAPAAAATAFVDRQGADQFLASDLIGMKVRGGADETLGEINDLLLDRNGGVTAAVIGVGGFLGMGAKTVAVPFQTVELTRNADGAERLVLRRTKDELKSAPDFAKYQRPAPAATGSVTPPPPTTPPATTR